MDQLAVLIPCYNESATIGKVVADCIKHTQNFDAAIYVYDNNSTNGTAAIAAAAGAIVRPEYKQGKGNVIRRMFREIDAQCYIMLDGDDTYPPEYIEEMARIVLGRRPSWFRTFPPQEFEFRLQLAAAEKKRLEQE